MVSTRGGSNLGFFWGGDKTDYWPGSESFCDLNGRRADTSGGTEHENRFSSLKATTIDKTEHCRLIIEYECGSLGERHFVRQFEHLIGVAGNNLGMTGTAPHGNPIARGDARISRS